MSPCLQSLPSLPRCELTVMLITGPSSAALQIAKGALGIPRREAQNFPCPVLSASQISLKAFSRHEAILTNVFENHHGLTRGAIKMTLGMARPSLPPPNTHSRAPTLKVRSSGVPSRIYNPPKLHPLPSTTESYLATTSFLLC